MTGYAAINEPSCGLTGNNQDCNRYGTSSSMTLSYNTTTGYTASTTGNITGIYDMSGGSWEVVMGVMLDQSGQPISGRSSLYNSGFNGIFGEDGGSLTDGISISDTKYYDGYSYSKNENDHSLGILGDAGGEMGPFYSNQIYNRSLCSWYQDESYAVKYVAPWTKRGSLVSFGNGAGIFAYDVSDGRATSANGFRLVLSVS